MPVVEAQWDAVRRAWIVGLPGNVFLEARDEAAVETLVRRYASGAAVRYVRPAGGDR